ncbi:hypothetical protein Hypma_004311 [Hypsizygus marmoreus]|uniref:Uncharacterized protein n=1 Tax=Hypsizygus marmoreus TaxID=39966 RepID=A0A369K8Q7_HYPMA|nr:hypothetical protein Hypma_004311 [Hypsizygus marmoreus]
MSLALSTHEVAFPGQELGSSAASRKENTPLRQTALLAALDKGMQKGKKRSLTLVNGEELDLMSPIPVTPQVLEAMRLRIIELEDGIAQQPPAKRARTSNGASAPAPEASAGPSAASTKAEEKKRKMQVKKIFDRLKKECRLDACKFQGAPKTIKFDEVYEQSEFQTLFSGKGTLIQPTPENKPKSVVTIIHFSTPAQLEAFFGDELKALKGNIWSRGGMPARAFGAGFGGFGSTFTKSVKQGACDVTIRSLEVNYSKNNMKCSLKFEVAQVGGYDDLDYDSDDSDW